MDGREGLAERFEQGRPHLRAVAYRMLGSLDEAEDAVQESWLHVSRSDTSDVQNLDGWMTTVVARVCLDALRSRRTRREESLDVGAPEPAASREDGTDPEHEALLADLVGRALLVVLDRLKPAERVAFVLHDVFGVSFDEIAPIVARSPVAARQMASRARRRVQGADGVPEVDPTRQRAVVQAFLAASRGGDLGAFLAVLDPEVVVRADRAAVRLGAEVVVRGSSALATTLFGRARGAHLALVNGAVGAVWAPGGRPRVAFGFTIVAGKIVEIRLLAEPDLLRRIEVAILDE